MGIVLAVTISMISTKMLKNLDHHDTKTQKSSPSNLQRLQSDCDSDVEWDEHLGSKDSFGSTRLSGPAATQLGRTHIDTTQMAIFDDLGALASQITDFPPLCDKPADHLQVDKRYGLLGHRRHQTPSQVPTPDTNL